jgi:hypothetical protein
MNQASNRVIEATTSPATGAATPGIASTDSPLYYLENFQTVLDWVGARYQDLLTPEETGFITRFRQLPGSARALLVRMTMRKGDKFRSGKLRYREIGDPMMAVRPLADLGWVDIEPDLAIGDFFALATRAEILDALGRDIASHRMSKAALLDELVSQYPETRTWRNWYPASGESVLQLVPMALIDRLRLLFFGNLHQDWSEFILSDLGLFRYETVHLGPDSRPFSHRRHLDLYLAMHQCREHLHNLESNREGTVDTVEAMLPTRPDDNDWLAGRHDRLLFKLGRHCERQGDLERAQAYYRQSLYPEARARHIRVLELRHRWREALALAETARKAPVDEAEIQRLERMLPRLRRKAGTGPTVKASRSRPPSLHLELPGPSDAGVERLAAQALTSASAPVYYVENTLINALLGLLCWNTLFAPVAGAFFHPFQRGPADLHGESFTERRRQRFESDWRTLETGRYRDIILANYRRKRDIQNPFVAWPAVDEALLQLALDCIPAAHLRLYFERILFDIKRNRSGLPDLIRFHLPERRYELIEVKGPGDRLQDNQLRWFDYCLARQLPASVCHVRWTGTTARGIGGEGCRQS